MLRWNWCNRYIKALHFMHSYVPELAVWWHDVPRSYKMESDSQQIFFKSISGHFILILGYGKCELRFFFLCGSFFVVVDFDAPLEIASWQICCLVPCWSITQPGVWLTQGYWEPLLRRWRFPCVHCSSANCNQLHPSEMLPVQKLFYIKG